VAFALILLAGAGLLIRTFAALTAIAPGFRPDHVLTVRLSLPQWKYSGDHRRAVLEELLERMRTGPGVDSAGLATSLPYGGYYVGGLPEIMGKPSTESNTDSEAAMAAVNFISGDYFRAIGIPVLAGRAVDSSDRAGKPAVAVVNETFARRFLPGQPAIGTRFRVGGVTNWMEIVGVAGSVKQNGLASQPSPEVWQPAAQNETGSSAQTLAIHSDSPPGVLTPWVRAQIAAVDKDLPPPEIETMRERMAKLVASQRFVLRLLALFAGIAVCLAAVGIYSVLVYSVERRAHEIGIRVALGARRGDILGLVVGRGLRLSLAGAALGVAGALGLTRYLETLLYGVKPHDPVTLALGSTLLIVTALVAAWLPARRAVGQDAVSTLRGE